MSRVEGWPIEYGKDILVGNLNRSIAVCSLWSERNFTAGKVGTENVAVVGNLYSHGPGVEGIIRNILANPSISTIVIAGKDKSDTAETLINLKKMGVVVTEAGLVIPRPDVTDDDIPLGLRMIDPAIPVDAINLLREHLELIDLREFSWDEIRDRVSMHIDRPPFAEPRVFAKTKSRVRVMQGEEIGFRIQSEKVYDTWLEILRTTRQFGVSAASRYSSLTQEILNVMAIVDDDVNTIVQWPNWVGIRPEAVLEYSDQLLRGVEVDSEDSYAYGQRMRVQRGDQVSSIIEKLKTNPVDRGLYLDLWEPYEDLYGSPQNPPCMTNIWFRVHNGRLYASFEYRSHDLFDAWLRNTVAARLLQAYIANEAGIPLGPTSILSRSAHIYEHRFAAIDRLLEEHQARWQFREDPRGNFVITIENGEIMVRHENKSGAITTLHARSAERLWKEIWAQKLLLLPDHGMYIGYELGRAERCLQEGTRYDQDRA